MLKTVAARVSRGARVAPPRPWAGVRSSRCRFASIYREVLMRRRGGPASFRVGLKLFAAGAAAAIAGPAPNTGKLGRRYVIRGGSVMTMDPAVGNFAQAGVLVDGKELLAVGPNLAAGGAAVIDATGRIVMPGFIDTHHHQFETALRGFLADRILLNDGSNTPSTYITYIEYVLFRFAPVYRPQDVYINELFGGLARRRRHNGIRRLADPSFAAALRRRHPGAVRYGAPSRVRLFRGCGQ
jgi:5-methylthioadenosine/S-adenosylhomocysteine deaminase